MSGESYLIMPRYSTAVQGETLPVKQKTLVILQHCDHSIQSLMTVLQSLLMQQFYHQTAKLTVRIEPVTVVFDLNETLITGNCTILHCIYN